MYSWDDLPAPSPRAGRHLQQILADPYLLLLPEWLGALAAAGKRVPAFMLHPLLELGRADYTYRDTLLPVLGKRGRSVAAQNPDWAYAAGNDPADVDVKRQWRTGCLEDRLALLARLRRTDADLARALVESVERTEPEGNRGRMIGTFSIGLSPADESFLERGLDDRGSGVRSRSAELLARLPKSLYVQRAVARATPLLTLKPGDRPVIEATLPEETDEVARRDGAGEKWLFAKVSNREWQLGEIVKLVPPAHWNRVWGKTPAEILAALSGNQYEVSVARGWSEAAARVGDGDWAEALIDHVFPRLESRLQGPLVATLSPEQFERVAITMLRKPAVDSVTLNDLVYGYGRPWTQKAARAMVQALRERIAAGTEWLLDHQLLLASVNVARYLPVALLSEFESGWPEDAEAWGYQKSGVEAFLKVMEFRREMLEEIRK